MKRPDILTASIYFILLVVIYGLSILTASAQTKNYTDSLKRYQILCDKYEVRYRGSSNQDTIIKYSALWSYYFERGLLIKSEQKYYLDTVKKKKNE